ncbi:MAG TPA: flavin reductase family protein [Chloroflexota bacterium]|jgi:3-hydroxy-9,10-secoandrosta-1,3,5(10)-triene-9,17-dione monooxygenase reductase component|nr:flavin reductase family protein [Chloroflexota bacterium]
MAIQPIELRRILGHFATGVTVVTGRSGTESRGITVNSFTSVSLDPPLVLICIDRRARTYEFLPRAGAFAVNILGEHQRWLCERFARRSAPDVQDELAAVPHHFGMTGAPLLDGCIAYLECRIVGRHDAGDHAIFIAEVVAATAGEPSLPLLFFRGTYPRLARTEILA